MAGKKSETIGQRIMVENVVLNWANNLFQIDDGDRGSGKYGCTLLIPKTADTTIGELVKALQPIYMKGCETGPLDGKTIPDLFKRAVKGDVDPDFGWPVKDGDEYAARRRKADERKGREDGDKRYGEYEGHWYIQASSKNRPRLYSRDAIRFDDDDPKARDLFHSGAIVNANLYAFVYEGTSSTKPEGGVSFWINDVQWVAEGTRIGGSGNPFQPLGPTPMPEGDDHATGRDPWGDDTGSLNAADQWGSL